MEMNVIYVAHGIAAMFDILMENSMQLKSLCEV